MITMQPDYSPIPTSALLMLAHAILRRTKLSLPCTNREQALGVIRGIRPAPPRKSPLNIKPAYALCCVCYKPMATGTLCDSLGQRHIQCEGEYLLTIRKKVRQHLLEHMKCLCLPQRPDAPWHRADCPVRSIPEAPYKVQARSIATMYNNLAQAEERPDLEEQCTF